MKSSTATVIAPLSLKTSLNKTADKNGLLTTAPLVKLAANIENLFSTYSYKNYQLKLEKIEKKKLSKYFSKYFLAEKNRTIIPTPGIETPNNNSDASPQTVGIASLKPFRLLQDVLGYPAASLKDFYVTEKIGNDLRCENYKNLGKWLLEQFKTNKKMFVAAKVAIQDNDAIKQLYNCGFNYVASESIYSLYLDIKRIATLNKSRNNASTLGVRLAEEKDHDAIKEIACTNHDINKFHLDASISKETSQIIYKKTIEASINNKNHTLLVHEQKGEITGFITVIFNQPLSKLMGRNYGSLDYISVKKTFREQGIGIALNNAGLIHLSNKNCEIVSVKTLSHNYPACNLLLANFFKLASSSLILHRHQGLHNL